jgi:hypothetical protein
LKQFKLTLDDVADVVAQLSAEDRTRVYYEVDALFAPDDLGDVVTAVVGNLPAARRDALKRYAAAKRYAVEVGGVAVSGVSYPSDRETQSKFTSAAVMATINPSASFEWKTADGFKSLSGAELLTVASAVGAHVQACFAFERFIGGAIDGETVTSREAIDAAAWPANG